MLHETQDLLTSASQDRADLSRARVLGLLEVSRTLTTMIGEQLAPSHDPMVVTARRIGRSTADPIRSEARRKVDAEVSAALEVAGALR